MKLKLGNEAKEKEIDEKGEMGIHESESNEQFVHWLREVATSLSAPSFLCSLKKGTGSRFEVLSSEETCLFGGKGKLGGPTMDRPLF